jgi:hypothetical protein
VSPIAHRQRKNITVHGVPHLFGRESDVMRPFAPEIVAGNFGLAAGDCRVVRLDLAQAFFRTGG